MTIGLEAALTVQRGLWQWLHAGHGAPWLLFPPLSMLALGQGVCWLIGSGTAAQPANANDGADSNAEAAALRHRRALWAQIPTKS